MKASCKYFDAYVETLRTKRGKPRDQQIHDLLHQHYTMRQGNKESVAEFANRFNQTQFELEKLVPNINRLPTTKDTQDICCELELIHAVVIKLSFGYDWRKNRSHKTHCHIYRSRLKLFCFLSK